MPARWRNSATTGPAIPHPIIRAFLFCLFMMSSFVIWYFHSEECSRFCAWCDSLLFSFHLTVREFEVWMENLPPEPPVFCLSQRPIVDLSNKLLHPRELGFLQNQGIFIFDEEESVQSVHHACLYGGALGADLLRKMPRALF